MFFKHEKSIEELQEYARSLRLQPKTIGWLKQRIKKLPDDYPVYFKDEQGNRHPLVEFVQYRDKPEAVLNTGGLDAEIEPLIVAGKWIEACRLYRDLTGANLMEAKKFIDRLREHHLYGI